MSEAVQARHALDVVTIGRASVDLYGQQIGSRLEDITSFAKSVGGCPANISVGTARLGLRSALLTRVGDEQMGRFIREQLTREGVNVDGLKTDKERLTALVLLSVEEEAIIVAFRKHTLLPLDDCLYALQPTIPHLTRSSLHRCPQRHGIGRFMLVEIVARGLLEGDRLGRFEGAGSLLGLPGL